MNLLERAKSRTFLPRLGLSMALLAALIFPSACQFGEKDDPLVIRDEDPVKVFMFPPSRHAAWTYRRQTVGLIQEEATVSIAVDSLRKDSATLTYAREGGESAEIAQGVGIRGEAEMQLRPDGAVTLKDAFDELTYYPDGRVESKDGVEFELLGTEMIETPAGTFACVKYRLHRGPSEDFPMTLEGTQWWGKKAGLVKAVSTVEGFQAGTRTTIELVSLER